MWRVWRRERPGESSTDAWAAPLSAQGVRAETAQIQPRPGLRDSVSGLLSAGKASFEVRRHG